MHFSSYRTHLPVPVATSGGGTSAAVFKISAQLGAQGDYNGHQAWVDWFRTSRGFTTPADPYNTAAALDSNGYASVDYCVVLPQLDYSASAQLLKCYIGGTGTITVSGTGYTITNTVVTAGTTTFDFNIAAGVNTAVTRCVIQVVSSARPGGGAGCVAFVVKTPGYSIADTTIFVPSVIAFTAPYPTLRFMDWAHTNGNTTTINPADRPSDTKIVRAIVDSATVSVEDCARLCNTNNQNLWYNIPSAASDALVTTLCTAIQATLNAGSYCVLELGNENWNAIFSQRNYWAEQMLAFTSGFAAQYALTRYITAASRAGAIVTITTSLAHGYSVAQNVGVDLYNNGGTITIAIAGVYALTAVTSNTFSFNDGGTGTGTITLNTGGTSCIGNMASALTSYDSAHDQFLLARRFLARRIVQISALAAAVFTTGFNTTRCRVVMMDQPGQSMRDACTYIKTVHGPTANYLYAIGNASYTFYDASQFGGSNLADVDTFGGFTPPQTSDYIAAITLTSAFAKGAWPAGDNYDGMAITARIHGVKLMQYEFGPNSNGTGQAVNTEKAKIAALFDPTYQAPYTTLLNNLEKSGYEEVCLYVLGYITTATVAVENNSWPIHGLDTTYQPRESAITAVRAQTRTGVTRNPLAASGTTVINARNYSNNWFDLSNFNTAYVAVCTDYLITAATAGVYSFVLTVDEIDTLRSAFLFVNGVNDSTYNFNVGGTNIVKAAVNISLTKGANVIQLVENGYVGPQVLGKSHSFTI